MGFTVPLSILLICLVHFYAAVDGNVDPVTLRNIVNNLENQLGDQGQYAVAFSVEKEKCLKNSGYTGQDLITQAVKDAFERNDVYVGTDLISAKPKEYSEANPPYTEHAEFRIQNFLKNILKRENRCVIYFTVNSPCMDKCLKRNGRFTIDNSLRSLQKEETKAFVFKKIWRYDVNLNVPGRLKEIAPTLPYYQCGRKNCVALQDDN